MIEPHQHTFTNLNRGTSALNCPQMDILTSNTMIYITNYELRDYQLQMVTSAIHSNTLICIPTGLGKTFIGAVLIANYHRWYPNGKIIFATPSRPLLIQQMNAIKDILQLNSTEYTEISGSVDPNKRISKWQNYTIFFGTPQAIQNDIDSGIVDCSTILLVIVDEAHRAQGDYSYCKIVSSITSVTPFVRIVGLTATPGQNFMDIQQLINNLRIEKIESDACTQYSHKRKIYKIVIPKSPGFDAIQLKLNSLLKPLVNSLNKKGFCKIDDVEKLTKGSMAILNKQHHQSSYEFFKIIRILGLKERLEDYSIDIFEKSLLEDGGKDLSFLLDITSKLLHDDLKMNKLIELVLDHLQNNNQQIIIFCNYRLVVSEIVSNLRKNNIRCEAFIGQSNSKSSKGLHRSKQIQIMELFKQKAIDVLVSTSIGEEGLDIGEVGFIICYDIPKSLTRMIQRIGRTGRKHDGEVYFLINETSKSNYLINDEKMFDNSFESISNNFIQCNKENFQMYDNPVKLVPENLTVIYKKVNKGHPSNSNIVESTRSCLNEKEKYELTMKFGSKLLYHEKQVEGIKYLDNRFRSNENQILMNLFFNKKRDDYFAMSSIDDNDNDSSDSESLSFPSIKPINTTFLPNSSNETILVVPDSPISFLQLHRNHSNSSYKEKLNNHLNTNHINRQIDGRYFYRDMTNDTQKDNNSLNGVNLEINANDNDSFFVESESFISQSSELICSASDDFEELENSPTFINF